MLKLPWEILNPIIRSLDHFQAKKAANALHVYFIDEDESHRLWLQLNSKLASMLYAGKWFLEP
jgi:hypothetical protein